MSVPHAVHGPLGLEQLVARVSAPDRGATASFLGTVRAGPDDGPVVRIEYSAYEEMLDEEFGRITAEAAARWPGAAIAALRERLAEGHRLPSRPLVARNRAHALFTDPLADGDELALLPPLAGG